jgi:hypothetical protein
MRVLGATRAELFQHVRGGIAKLLAEITAVGLQTQKREAQSLHGSRLPKTTATV